MPVLSAMLPGRDVIPTELPRTRRPAWEVPARNETVGRLLLVAAVSIAFVMAGVVQASLCPGQFTGRVKIGTRVILGGTFSATSTSPLGFDNNATLNGTQWNGTDLSGPPDASGYTVSAQSDLPGCDPSDSTLVVYNLQATGVSTSSTGLDDDVTLFPVAISRTVGPQATTVVEFKESNPWILDVDVTNLGCPTSDMYQISIVADSSTNGITRTSSDNQYQSIASRLTTDGMGHQVRYLDIPLITGSPNTPLNTFTVQVSADFMGASQPSVTLSVVVGPADVNQNGHIAVHWVVQPECVACLDANLVGSVTLNGLTPGDGHSATYVHSMPSTVTAPYASVAVLPGTYDMSGGMSAGRYYPYANSFFEPDGLITSLRWPLSTWRNYDGIDGNEAYVDLACQETDHFDFMADIARIQGDMTYTCKARYEPKLVAAR